MVWPGSVPLRATVDLPYSTDTDIGTKVDVSRHGGCTDVEPVGVEGSELVSF